MILELVPSNDPILREEMERFDFTNPPVDPIELAADLGDTMNANNGLGLAANQVGLPYRVFVMRGADLPIVCFNPIIVDESSETVVLEEGCLSHPNLFVKIKRARRIKVRYAEPNGNVVTKIFDGMTARVFQHELDHLEGICHLQRANRYHLEQARKNAKKMKKPKSMSLEAMEFMSTLA